MTEIPHVATTPNLDVDDKVFAKLAAFEAAQTPGVARLHPYVIQAARNAVTTVAKRASAKLTGADGAVDTTSTANAADPAAVDVDHDADTGALTVTIRVVATTRPPVLSVVRDVQQRVNSRITELSGVVPVVIVNVLDIDPPEQV